MKATTYSGPVAFNVEMATFTLKRPCFLGFSLSFSVLYSFFVNVKHTKLQDKVRAKGSYSLLQKTLLDCLKCQVSGPTFTSVTYLHHYVTQHHFQLGVYAFCSAGLLCEQESIAV